MSPSSDNPKRGINSDAHGTFGDFPVGTPPDSLTQCVVGTETSRRMAGSDKRKQSLYFPEDMLKEIQDEANRQDRSLSWIVQKAWKIARKEIMKYPSVNEFPGEEDEKEIA
jgi:uncharacterized small protein (TIGR04563 family)